MTRPPDLRENATPSDHIERVFAFMVDYILVSAIIIALCILFNLAIGPKILIKPPFFNYQTEDIVEVIEKKRTQDTGGELSEFSHYIIERYILWQLRINYEVFLTKKYAGDRIVVTEEYRPIGQSPEEMWRFPTSGFISFIALFFYFIYSEYKFGTTLGKKIYNMRLISKGRENQSLARIFIRSFVKLFPPLLIVSYFFVAFGKSKRALHDYAARTSIVKIVA